VIVLTMFQAVLVLLLEFEEVCYSGVFFCCNNNSGQNLTVFLVIILEIRIIAISVS